MQSYRRGETWGGNLGTFTTFIYGLRVSSVSNPSRLKSYPIGFDKGGTDRTTTLASAPFSIWKRVVVGPSPS